MTRQPAPGSRSDQWSRGEEIAGHIDDVGIIALDARDNGAELAILERVAVFAQHLDAELVDRALEALKGRLPIVVVHGHDGDALESEIVTDEFRRRAPLRRTKVDAAKDVIAGARDVGVHSVGRNERNTGLLEDGGSGATGGRVASGYRKFHAVLAQACWR